MAEVNFKNRKINTDKLLAFGFVEMEDGYSYSADLAEGQMTINIVISGEGRVFTEVIDKNSGEEYELHLVPGAAGSFVGLVKEEYETLLEKISRDCFDPEIFKYRQSQEVIAYVKETYGDELEFLWEKFPDNAIWRRKDNKKWYGAILTVAGCKIGLDTDEKIEIIDLRIRPEELETLIDNKKYFPGYHMNKKHWYTMCLDGSVSLEEICRRIDESYTLALK